MKQDIRLIKEKQNEWNKKNHRIVYNIKNKGLHIGMLSVWQESGQIIITSDPSNIEVKKTERGNMQVIISNLGVNQK